ncbi:hypothetical protein [Paenibacillus sp. SN-8-1]|uniref:hypothetical protein n=1 Tax=Paenibacillus sp. SN-8-1 TaxID=3435409 RepID=UPI003D9A5757
MKKKKIWMIVIVLSLIIGVTFAVYSSSSQVFLKKTVSHVLDINENLTDSNQKLLREYLLSTFKKEKLKSITYSADKIKDGEDSVEYIVRFSTIEYENGDNSLVKVIEHNFDIFLKKKDYFDWYIEKLKEVR